MSKKLSGIYERYAAAVQRLRDLPLLFFRLTLAYGFSEPALNKWRGFEGVVSWFRDSLHIPFPVLNAYLAMGTEMLGVVLLTLGLGVRLIGIPLMVVMIVAIKTVHLGNGFACGDNGFEVPFYYLLMLFALVVYGAGRISLDHLIRRSAGARR